MHTDLTKIAAVEAWPIPTIRGLLGLTSYYRRFIRNYGKIAAPLTSLLKKSDSKGWKWPLEAAVDFNNLKNELVYAPLLAMPNFGKPSTIDYVASGVGLEAILMQRSQPVAYFSKALSEHTLARL